LNGYEITFGAQKRCFYDWTFGLAGSYESDNLHYLCCGNGRNTTWLGGLYGLYRPNDYYVLADFVYGHSNNSMHRSMNVGTLSFQTKSHPKVSQFTFYGEVGVDYKMGCFFIQPFAGLEVGSYWRHQIEEQGDSELNLIIHKRNRATVHTRLGVHITANSLPYNSSVSLDLAWNKRLTNRDNSIIEQFANFGDSFTVNGVDLDPNVSPGETCAISPWFFIFTLSILIALYTAASAYVKPLITRTSDNEHINLLIIIKTPFYLLIKQQNIDITTNC
jgi:uncharacterized protein with beta-barrel porin domain